MDSGDSRIYFRHSPRESGRLRGDRRTMPVRCNDDAQRDSAPGVPNGPAPETVGAANVLRLTNRRPGLSVTIIVGADRLAWCPRTAAPGARDNTRG